MYSQFNITIFTLATQNEKIALPKFGKAFYKLIKSRFIVIYEIFSEILAVNIQVNTKVKNNFVCCFTNRFGGVRFLQSIPFAHPPLDMVIFPSDLVPLKVQYNPQWPCQHRPL